ncbi:LysM peptidoglycan-binding and 3D domain-containing protein [Alkalihalobacterium chitinilyticum]|uniref:LysM peptidoglycan-binding domain-containing protein n=1 Tax=Alkalihalobacterium chitinilyticum TaxID=2980103 RepID=A0ABT5VJG9_9BACI|nr:LysM peptidoglycan-binding and 3D domain-containing protein [Alkalihalobacterium chitinilyticum]MDE5415457.1 LysM peptidoglycan-binding domain-containing protein [Alkalihalobacterium chitinilyticum]
MKKSIVSLVTVAAIYGTFGLGSHTSAKEVTVQKGDTLWEIAKANDILVEDLKEWNGLTNHIIHPEDRLKVALTEEYYIQKGDTLSEIALQFDNISWKALQDWNQINDPDFILAGDTLTVYLKGTPQATTQAKEVANVTDTEGTRNTEVSTTSDVKQEKVKEPSSVPDEPVQEKAVSEEPMKEESNKEETIKEEPVKEETIKEDPVKEEPAAEEAMKEEEVASKPASDDNVAMELTMTATAYTASCEGCSGITSTGINLIDNPDKKVISVDPSVIPLGSKVYVEGYGHAIAGDTGGAIQGNKIDIFIPNKQDAINWGVQEVNVKVFK